MIVIDASAAVDQVMGGDAAAAVERHTAYGVEDLHAPHVLDLEVVQALRRARKPREMMIDFLDLPIERYPHTLLVPRVWELRRNFTPFDATYVALAEALGDDVRLLTSDRRLARATRKHTDVEVLLAA